MYCYACGASLADHPPTTCANCGVPHYGSATPCASCFVTRGREVLLIRRGIEPYKGFWDSPAGFCDPDEHPSDTAVRETLEETGLEVKVTTLLGIWLGHYNVPSDPEPPKRLMNVMYVAEVTGGTLTATEEAPEAAWFDIDDFPAPLYPEKQAATEALRTLLANGR
jgi:8-oxo-dGTP diphosphatase